MKKGLTKRDRRILKTVLTFTWAWIAFLAGWTIIDLIAELPLALLCATIPAIVLGNFAMKIYRELIAEHGIQEEYIVPVKHSEYILSTRPLHHERLRHE